MLEGQSGVDLVEGIDKGQVRTKGQGGSGYQCQRDYWRMTNGEGGESKVKVKVEAQGQLAGGATDIGS